MNAGFRQSKWICSTIQRLSPTVLISRKMSSSFIFEMMHRQPAVWVIRPQSTVRMLFKMVSKRFRIRMRSDHWVHDHLFCPGLASAARLVLQAGLGFITHLLVLYLTWWIWQKWFRLDSRIRNLNVETWTVDVQSRLNWMPCCVLPRLVSAL